jgi:hypothetical protein
MPEIPRKSQLRGGISAIPCGASKVRAIAHVKTTITDVRMAVARFGSIPATPTFASSAVAAAKNAESIAQKNQPIDLEPTLFFSLTKIERDG